MCPFTFLSLRLPKTEPVQGGCLGRTIFCVPACEWFPLTCVTSKCCALLPRLAGALPLRLLPGGQCPPQGPRGGRGRSEACSAARGGVLAGTREEREPQRSVPHHRNAHCAFLQPSLSPSQAQPCLQSCSSQSCAMEKKEGPAATSWGVGGLQEANDTQLPRQGAGRGERPGEGKGSWRQGVGRCPVCPLLCQQHQLELGLALPKRFGLCAEKQHYEMRLWHLSSLTCLPCLGTGCTAQHPEAEHRFPFKAKSHSENPREKVSLAWRVHSSSLLPLSKLLVTLKNRTKMKEQGQKCCPRHFIRRGPLRAMP